MVGVVGVFVCVVVGGVCVYLKVMWVVLDNWIWRRYVIFDELE